MASTPQAAASKRSVCSSPGESAGSSPCEHGGQKRHPNLSSALRERLKRSRRSFTSPCSVAKRLCVDGEAEEDGGRQVAAGAAHRRQTDNNPSPIAPGLDVNRNVARSSGEGISGCNPKPEHSPPGECERLLLRKEVKEKTETLRRLKMVKMYRSKNDLTTLQALIDKWRSCAQAALYELQSDVSIDGGRAGLSDLIDLFGLDDGILHFDRTEEDFTS